MPLKLFRIMPCSVCEKEILTVVAEVDIETEGSKVKFQSYQQLKEGLIDAIVVASYLSRSTMNSRN